MLDASVFESVTAQHAKTLGQAVNTVTEAGIGKFGIQPKQLLELGVLKPGVIDFANASVSQINEALTDPAMFTGLDNVNSLGDILNSETLQSDLVSKGMDAANSVMKQAGVLTGGESIMDTATMLGSSMIGTGSDIVAMVNGKGDALLNAAMLNVGKASQFATALAEGPAKEVLDGITSKVGAVKGLTNAVGNVNMGSLDKAANSLIGNVKIPSVSAISDAVKGAIDPSKIVEQATDQFKGAIDSVTDIAGSATDLVGDALSGKLEVPNLGDLSGALGDISNIKGAVGSVTGALGGIVDNGIAGTISDSLIPVLGNADTRGGQIGGSMLSGLIGGAVEIAVVNKIPPGVKQITRFI